MLGRKEKFRLDRLIALGVDKLYSTRIFMFASNTGNNKKSSNHIPVLMYHSISESSYPDKHPYYQTHTPLSVFSRHMEILSDGLHDVLGLKEAVNLLGSSKEIEGNPVVITFDDAYDDFLTHALPVLKKYRFPATVFVASGLVGKRDPVFLNKRCMAWDELAGLVDHGIEIGSHTISHPKLYELPLIEMEKEVVVSRSELRKNLGIEIDAFSCPYAFPEADNEFVRSYLELLAKGGYQYGVTTCIGRAPNYENRYLMRRLPINYADDDHLFTAKLNGAYDWMSSLQRLKKKIQHIIN